MSGAKLKTLLFLCTGNYYRSRFAELYFRHRAAEFQLPWSADSRGLGLSNSNVGPLSQHTADECERLGVCYRPLRSPLPLTVADLVQADLVIAVKEIEHRPLLGELFPDWNDRVTYWQVHDLDCAPPEVALRELRHLVDGLIESLRVR